jgi:hypothetical protein
MKKKILRTAMIILLLVFVVGEVLTFNKTQHEVDLSKDLLTVSNANHEVVSILKSACYDCHSYETDYVWYTYIFPVSYWTEDHVEHARKHLNFNTWTDYSAEDRKHIAEECIEEVKEGEMPLKSYTWMHRDARLTDEQKTKLYQFFSNL